MKRKLKLWSFVASPDTRRAFFRKLLGLATTGAAAIAVTRPHSSPGPREIELEDADLHRPHNLAG